MTWCVAFGFIRNGVMSIQSISGHCFYEIPVLYIEYAKWVASLALKNQPVPFRESMLQIMEYYSKYYLKNYPFKLENYRTCDFHVTATSALGETVRIEHVIDDEYNPTRFVNCNNNCYFKHFFVSFLSIALLNYDTGCFEYHRANDSEIKNFLSDDPKFNTMECKYSMDVFNTPQYVSIPFTDLENITPNYDEMLSNFQNIQDLYPELM